MRRPSDARGETLRAALGVLLGLVARCWLLTLRVTVELAPELGRSDQPWALAFWHGTQWPLLAWGGRRRTAVMVSWSRDGAMQARALGVLGLVVVRGSSSRGGARGLAALVRLLRGRSTDVAFAVDGPRGPAGRAKEGVLLASRASGALLVPVGAAAARVTTFRRAWDRFVLVWPFSRVVVRLGAPIEPEAAGATERLEAAIHAANRDAAASLRGVSGKLGQAGDRFDLDTGAAG